jgi:hypothetical protein
MIQRERSVDLEAEIVRLCGLSQLLAPGLLRRALADVGATSPASPEALLRALPKIEARMGAYLPQQEVKERSVRMRAMLAQAEALPRHVGTR